MMRAIPIVVAAALFPACASGPTIRSEVDPSADLASYRTFTFLEPFGLDRDGFRTPIGTMVRDAVQHELLRRGLQPVAEGGDLLVNAGGNIVDKQRVDTYPTTGYYGYRHGYYGGWSGYPDVVVTNYREGSLTIDLVDRARKQMVWTATAVGKVRDVDQETRKQNITNVVAEIFTTHPVPPK